MKKQKTKKFAFTNKSFTKKNLKKEINVVSNGESITKDREPFILISNKLTDWDSIIVMQNIDYDVKFVSTELSFLDKSKKMGNNYITDIKYKKSGEVDRESINNILEHLKNGTSIGIFPERDKTFLGDTQSICENSGKLIKEAGVDVILVKQSGGYLSQPRWADTYAQMGFVVTNTETLITKKELEDLTPKMINNLITEGIHNNEYDFQKLSMLKFERENRAEGIERVVYYCNNCNSSMTVFGKGDDIYCSKCGKIGHFNEYEFIDGNEFDNLVDYNKYQYSFIEDVISSEFVFVATLSIIDPKVSKNELVGEYKVRYKDKLLIFTNKDSKYTFEFKKINNPINTMNDNFSFDYGKETYNLSNLRHQFVLFEMCRYINNN